MKKMRKKIIFQKCHFNNIYFLFYMLISFIDIIIDKNLFPNKDELKEINEEEKNFYLPAKILVSLYLINLSDFFAIIPHLIRKRLLNQKGKNITNINIEEDKNANDSSLIYNDYKISVTNKKKKIILVNLIYIGILDFFHKFPLILYHIIFSENEFNSYSFTCIVPFEIFFQFVCSYFVLKIHFYKLQYFSLFLNLGIFIIILIIDIINIKNEQPKFNWKIYFFYLFNIILYSIEYSLGKKILLYGYISLYLLIFIKGFIVLILNLIFSLITGLVNKKIFSRMGFFFTKQKYIWLMIAKIFSSSLSIIFTWLIIDIFSPNYFPLSLILYELCVFIGDIIFTPNYFSNNSWNLYIRIFLYIISLIGVMLHNEIVVINICNLGSDTKYFLDIELEKEELLSKTDNPEILQRYETMIEMESEDGNQNENQSQNN